MNKLIILMKLTIW